MRDTVRLRSRLAMLACLPALSGGTACQDPPGGPSRAEARSTPSDPGQDRAEPADRSKKVTVDVSKPKRAKLSAEQRRLLPIEGDPPYVEGYNPEEDTCPSGNWCGTVASAAPLAPNPDNTPMELGCPTRLVGAKLKDVAIAGNEYDGLSTKPTMQATLQTYRTAKQRDGGDEDVCCYHWFEYCSGRPLRDETSSPRVAERGTGPQWSSATLLDAETGPLDPVTAAALSEAWLDDALAEHASIAAFARSTLELMAVGAPPELLAATQAAALDEIDHARRCFSLAGRYGAQASATAAAVGPGRLDSPPPRAPTLPQLAVDTFIEGCVGETIAALIAERALGRADDEPVRETLAKIADDESRHAALAWRTLSWAITEGGTEVTEALRRAALEAEPHPHRDPLPNGIDPETWAAHGRLDPTQMAAAAHDAYQDVILPMLEDLLGQPRPTRPTA